MQRTPLNMMEILEQKSSSDSHIDTVIDIIRQQNAALESGDSNKSNNDAALREKAPRGQGNEVGHSVNSDRNAGEAAGAPEKEIDIEEKKKQELIRRHTKGVVQVDTRDYNDPEAFKIIKKEKFQGKTALAQHRDKYEESRKYQRLLQKQPISFDYIDEIKIKLKTAGIECKKYHYSLDKRTQQLTTLNSMLYLSEDERKFIVINKKPKLKAKTEKKEEEDDGTVMGASSKVRQELLGEQPDSDEVQDVREFDMEESESKAGCYIKNISGFVFGGFHSRFWMLRKHINSLPRAQLTKLPFYCWECISIET